MNTFMIHVHQVTQEISPANPIQTTTSFIKFYQNKDMLIFCVCIVCDWDHMAGKALNIYLILYTKFSNPCPKAMVHAQECSLKVTWESFAKDTCL